MGRTNRTMNISNNKISFFFFFFRTPTTIVYDTKNKEIHTNPTDDQKKDSHVLVDEKTSSEVI